MSDTNNKSTDNTLNINTVMLVKTGVFDCDECMLQILRDLINRLIYTVGTCTGEFGYCCRAVICKCGGRITLWLDAVSCNLRCIINHMPDDKATSDRCEDTADKDT